MSEITREKPGVKFLWSHQGRLHRYFVKTANKVLGMLPFRAKYLAVAKAKGRNIPYSLVEGKTVVQVGAPYDTLEAGRSRGMLFSQLVGTDGKVLIVEPLGDSVRKMKERLEDCGLHNTQVIESGAWSKQTTSVINVDLEHPATNYTGSTVDYEHTRAEQFEKIEISLNTLDSIVENAGLEHIDLVSITTNWAEEEILKGMSRVLNKGVEYVCLAYGKDGEDYRVMMAEYGYEVLSHDDRGVTYKKL